MSERSIDWPETNRRISERRERWLCDYPEAGRAPEECSERYCAWWADLGIENEEHWPLPWSTDKSLAFDLLSEMLDSQDYWVLLGPPASDFGGYPEARMEHGVEIEVTPTEEAYPRGAKGFVEFRKSKLTAEMIVEWWCHLNGVEIAYLEKP